MNRKVDWFEWYREFCKKWNLYCDIPPVEELYELPNKIWNGNRERILEGQQEYFYHNKKKEEGK